MAYQELARQYENDVASLDPSNEFEPFLYKETNELSWFDKKLTIPFIKDELKKFIDPYFKGDVNIDFKSNCTAIDIVITADYYIYNYFSQKEIKRQINEFITYNLMEQ